MKPWERGGERKIVAGERVNLPKKERGSVK